VEGINDSTVLSRRGALRTRGTESRPPGASMRSVKPLPVTPDGLAGQAPQGPPQTDEAGRTTFLGSLPKRGKVKGIPAGIAVASSGATSLFPTTSRTFPETEIKLEIPESWVKRHIVTPVKKMVRRDETSFSER